MRVLDLFSGSKSLLKPCKDMGFEYFSVEHKEEYSPDLVADILNITANDIPFKPDIIWASPPCTTYSIAAISHHRTKDIETGYLKPKSENAILADKVLRNMFVLIKEINPIFWFVENPRGGMRKSEILVPYSEFINTVCYCQYGDDRMKPTDIWTNNLFWTPRPMCKNGDPCHISAPRGSKTGTQGLKRDYERSKVPYDLLYEILNASIV